MTDTAALEEAERRYGGDASSKRMTAFIAGAEWRDAQVAQLVKAARNVVRFALQDDDGLWCLDCDMLLIHCEQGHGPDATCSAYELRAALRALSDPGEGAPEK